MEDRIIFPSLFFRQRLNAVGIPFLLGCFVFSLAQEKTGFFAVFLAAIFLGIFSLFFREKEGKFALLLAMLGLGLSLVVMGWNACAVSRDREWLGESCCVEGTVTASDSQSYDLALSDWDGAFSCRKVRVSSQFRPRLGEKIRLSGVLKEPSETVRQDGISFLISPCEEEILEGKNLLYSAVGALRSAAGSALGTDRIGGFYRAILLGDRNFLEEEVSRSFSRAGAAHLLAISGLHISQILGFLYCLFQLLPISYRRVRLLFLPVIVFLILLTGASVSVFRAGFMTAFSFLGPMFGRRSDSVTSMVLSAVLLVLWEPTAVTDPSFLLSFLSTFAILTVAVPLCDAVQRRFSSPRRKGFFSRLYEGTVIFFYSSFLISVSIFVFTFPVQLWIFGSVSLLVPLSSLILIPLFTPCLFGGILCLFFSCLSVPSGVSLCRALASTFLSLTESMAHSFPDPVSLGEYSSFFAAGWAIFLFFWMLHRRPLRQVFGMDLVLTAFCWAAPHFVN